MSIEIPSWLIDLHEEGVDAMLNSELAVQFTVLYQPKLMPCVNCILNPIGNKSSNVHRAGGPVPFPVNSLCPMCNGAGYRQEQATDTMNMQIIWNPKDWIDIGVPIKIPDGIMQCKGYMSDVQKIKAAVTLRLDLGDPQLSNTNWNLFSEPVPHGFRNKRYFLAFLKRA